MSFVPPNQVVESPAAIADGDRKRPPMLAGRPSTIDATTPITASPASSTFETGRTASVRLPSVESTPDVSKLTHVPAVHPHARRGSTVDIPQVIPPKEDPKEARTLILCFDGTGDQFDQDIRTKQMVYYQAGIGTSSKYFVTPVGVAMSKAVDMAIAHGLKDHVTDGYEFLMQNYSEGDKICLFGFSRGAYTARALAGMLHKVGLLPPFNYQQVPFAYHMYQRDDKEGWEMSNGFKQAFSIDVEIHFMGLFDTVNSVGLIPKELPFAKSNYVVRNFRHAVALDERRAKFKANLWGRISDEDAALAAPKREDYMSKKKREKLKRKAEEQKRATLYGYTTSMIESVTGAAGSMYNAAGSVYDVVGSVGGYVSSTIGYSSPKTRMGSDWAPDGSGITVPAPLPSKRPDFENMTSEERQNFKWRRGYSTDSSSGDDYQVVHAIGGKRIERTETDVEEVWFSGAHTDVGGGSVKNGERYSLARISLRWMVRQCFKCDTGIMFHTNMLEDIGLSPETLWPKVLPRPPPIRSFNDLPAASPPAPPLISRNSEPHPPAYSTLESQTNDPKFNSGHPGYKDASKLDLNDPRNPNAPKYQPYSTVTDREHTQLSRRVNPYEPYIPFTRFGHDIRDYGYAAREPREPFISEEVEDFKDALSPIYDQLSLNWWWWILEIIPVKQVWRKKEKSWRRFFSINFGGPRVIKNQKRNGVKVHRTVQIRMSSKQDLDGKPFYYSPQTDRSIAIALAYEEMYETSEQTVRSRYHKLHEIFPELPPNITFGPSGRSPQLPEDYFYVWSQYSAIEKAFDPLVKVISGDTGGPNETFGSLWDVCVDAIGRDSTEVLKTLAVDRRPLQPSSARLDRLATARETFEAFRGRLLTLAHIFPLSHLDTIDSIVWKRYKRTLSHSVDRRLVHFSEVLELFDPLRLDPEPVSEYQFCNNSFEVDVGLYKP
ncbi:choline transport protein [Ceratobasidium sp. AG-Ba]|nr:choline transport protein [Ceratobasidium sp. AG-Ba]